MEQEKEKKPRLSGTERLQKQINDTAEKINRLIERKAELEAEFDIAQRNEVLSIVMQEYKTPEELQAFIRNAKQGKFIFSMENDKNQSESDSEKEIENKERTEVENDFLESDEFSKDNPKNML